MKSRILTCFLFSVFFAFAQVKPYSYLVNTGLNDHRFNALSQDQFGRLIIATNKGVFSYNGFRSRLLESGKVKSSEFIEIVEVGNHCFGLNKMNQLVQIDLTSFNPIDDKLFQGEIKLIKSQNNRLIVATSKAIYFCQPKPFQVTETRPIPFNENGKKMVLDYAETSQGRFVLLSPNELIDIDDRSSRTVPVERAKYLLNSAKGLIILPSLVNKQNSFLFHQSRFTNLHRINPSITKSIERVVQFGNTAYICSEGAMFAYDMVHLKIQFQLPGFSVADILQDKSGTVWLATKRKGLVCVPAGSYDLVSTVDFGSLYQLPQMNGFAGLDVNGQLTLMNSKGKKINGINEDKYLVEFGLYEVNGMDLLSTSGGLFYYEKGWSKIKYPEKLAGVYSLKNGSILTIGMNGIIENNVAKFQELGKKKIKIKSYSNELFKGATRIDEFNFVVLSGEELFHFSLETGEMKEIKYYNESLGVHAIFDLNGKTGILTKNNLLLLYDGKRIIEERDLKEVNADIKIQKVRVVDGYIYLLSDNSLYRCRSLHGNIERLEQLSRMNGVYLRDFVVLKDRLVVATQFGLYHFVWKKRELTMPNFIIGRASGNNETTDLDGIKRFSYANSRINIPFEIVELGESHPFQLQYRLVRNGELKDRAWTNFSLHLNQLSFDYLVGGKYCVQMRLKDPYSKSVSAVQKRYFIIEYHWTERKWIWFLLGIVSTIVIGTYIRNREIKKKFKKLNAGHRID